MYTDAKVTDKIERQIIADKKIAEAMLAILPAVEKVVKDFDGKQVILKDGGFSKKFHAAINSVLNYTPSDRMWLKNMYRDTYLELSFWLAFGKNYFDHELTRESSDDGNYYSQMFCLFRHDGSTLEYKPEDFDSIRERCEQFLALDYEAVNASLDRVKELVRQATVINDSLPYYARLQLPYIHG